MTEIYGTAGNDHIVGSSTTFDVFHMEQGGSDSVECTAFSMNWLYFGATLDATDTITAVPGVGDWVYLEGDYSKTVVFTDQTIQLVDTIFLHSGYNYSFVTADGNVSAGSVLGVRIDNNQATPDFGLKWDGSAETDGRFSITGGNRGNTLIGGAQSDTLTGGAGTDLLIGNSGDDHLDAYGPGNDIALGGDGDDQISFTDLSSSDRIDGGAGFDTLMVGGVSVTLTHAFVTGIEAIQVIGYDVATIRTTDDLIAAHETLIVEIGNGDATLRWDGGAEKDGQFRLIAGKNADSLEGGLKSDKITGNGGDDVITGREGKDHISGGEGNDLIAGGGAADLLAGGAGEDTFAYTLGSNSSGVAFDTIKKFDAQQDAFSMFADVSQLDAKITKGTLSDGTFDHDLAAATNIAAHHAVLFKPSAGDFTGQTFLVIDQNGVPGYQSGRDIVIELVNPQHMADFSLGNFV
ncbi:MAG TPA: calcium-binding protein [Rhizomicrobium sp.]|jgi:Ca2+-binding RTX toxin-like protein|nr:calcium-binding protein [Rhizomicrobium sp.]